MNFSYLDQDDDWRSEYPFLADYDLNDEILLCKENFHMNTKIYALQQELKYIHYDDPRINIANTFLNPIFFPAGRQYTYYEFLFEIKWRIEYINISLDEISTFRIRVHDNHGKCPMYWLGSVERAIVNQIQLFKMYKRDWWWKREQFIASAQRKRVIEFYGLLKIKFANLKVSLDDVAVKIISYTFDFHPHNKKSIFSGDVSIRKKRHLSTMLTFTE